MDSELEVIRGQMHQTRASLADKLDALECQVRETVQSATDAVATTVDAVKNTVEGVSDTVKDTAEAVTDTVQSTVQSVAETLDLSHYAERHPWATFGVAVAAGFAGGYLLGGGKEDSGQRMSWEPTPRPAAKEEERVLSSWLPDGLQPAMAGLQGLAIGTLMGVVRELVTGSLPGLEPVKKELSGWIDQLTTGLGGKPMQFSLPGNSPQPARQEQGQGELAYQGPAPISPAEPPTQSRRQERRRADSRR